MSMARPSVVSYQVVFAARPVKADPLLFATEAKAYVTSVGHSQSPYSRISRPAGEPRTWSTVSSTGCRIGLWSCHITVRVM
jgi:hypothetical protein